MIAVQGPTALRIVEPLIGADVGGMSYYTGLETTVCRHVSIVSRTGYTGEDGCELIVPEAAAQEIWDRIFEAGKDLGLRANGLGARDTLRLEAAMPLYGHELSEEIDPFTAGLGFAVNLEGRDFIGKAAIAPRKNGANAMWRIGLELAGRRVPREHYPVMAGETQVGKISSGTFSPTLQKPIAMAYVQSAHAQLGASLTVDIRGTREAAQVVALPFYKRPSSK